MTRCDEFYEKVERDGNFCGMREDHYTELVAYIELMRENPQIRGIAEGAVKPLIHEKDLLVKVKAIETLGKQIEHGNVATAKQVKTILSNIRERVPTKGGDHMGAVKQKGDTGMPNDALKFYKSPSEVEGPISQGEDPNEIDQEEDYYSGDTPEIPDTQEMLETSKADVVVPHDVTDMEDQMEEERAAREARELQRKKEEEKNRREMVALEEKNENTRMRDELAVDLTDALKKAIRKGIPRKYVSDALQVALDNVFEAERPSGENNGNASQGALKSGGLLK